jgi:hypothetical protein
MAPLFDGQHRRFDPRDHSGWCRNLFDSLADHGHWGVPRSGLTFQRRGNQFVLVDRAPGFDAGYQQEDYETIKRQFATADIEVTDETNA